VSFLVTGAIPASVTSILASSDPAAYVRFNQVGYAALGPKEAVLISGGPETAASFRVVNVSSGQIVYTAPVGNPLGHWSFKFPDTYRLDFSSVKLVGNYSIQVHGPISAESAPFRIDTADHLYRSLLHHALFFYLTQRDGWTVDASVMDRQPSHLADDQALEYSPPVYRNDVLEGNLHRIGGPVNVSGGWFDAGDYLKFVETASYTDAIMLFAVREFTGLFDRGSANFSAEARYGLNWLEEMWNESAKTLDYQVGIGDGNRHTTADHDLWRLPQADDRLNVDSGDPQYYIKYRPVFQAGPPGSPISPNLAGRLAADFGLCFQVFHERDPAYADRCLRSGETVFDLAKTSDVGQLLTASPYDYYPETEWRDDLELGATELYFATALGPSPEGLPHTDPMFYLRAAAHWARAYLRGPGDGSDTLNLYDVSGLAHYDLFHAIEQAGNPKLEVPSSDLLGDLKKQLASGTAVASSDPFGFGVGYNSGTDLVPHGLGFVLEAAFYDQLARANTFRPFGSTQLNWVLGANAWGSSFIVGDGSTFPDCLHHQIANLAGSVNGELPIVLGATVDGPQVLSNFQGLGTVSGMHKCPPTRADPFRTFDGRGARYFDNVISWPSVEPTDDYTALSIVAFALQIDSR
jgi:hypothetical protein